MADIYEDEDRKQALIQGLLGAAFPLMGARRGQEFNAFGQAGLLGLGQYNRSLEGATEARDRKAQREQQRLQWEQAQEERAFKMQQLQQQQAQQQRLGNVYAQMPSHAPEAGVAPATAAQFGPAGGDSTGMAGMPPAPVKQVTPYDMHLAKGRYLEDAARKYPQDAQKLMDLAEKSYAAAKDWRDQNEGDIQFVRGPDGKMVGVQRKKYGDPQQFAGYQPPPKMTAVDSGGATNFVDLSGASPLPAMPKTMSFADKNAAANLDLSRQRFAREGASDNKPQWDAGSGQWITRPDAANPQGRAMAPEGYVKTNKPPVEYQKQISGMTNLHTAIEEYKQELQNWGGLDVVNPAARARMGTKYNNMMLQSKEAYNLGVLNGPDYMILQEVVTNPASLVGTITPNSSLSAQASTLDEIMKKNAANVARVHGQPVPEVAQTPATPEKKATPKQAPQVGTVRDGYRFKGGNPGDRNNWERV